MTIVDLRVAPRSVQREAVDKLRNAIMLGVFKPGDKLVEADLCESLGVSRPSVREALRSLEAERLVAIVPNRGPQIPVLTWDSAAEIYQVRALLEGEAAALCAKRAGVIDLAAMRAALDAFERAVGRRDLAAQLATTAAFYAEMLQLCGNYIVEEMLQGLHARINFLRSRSMSLPGRARHSIAEMRAIFDAIERGDSRGARRAAAHHVAEARAAAKMSYDSDALGKVGR